MREPDADGVLPAPCGAQNSPKEVCLPFSLSTFRKSRVMPTAILGKRPHCPWLHPCARKKLTLAQNSKPQLKTREKVQEQKRQGTWKVRDLGLCGEQL